jgi:hypothetical protein
MGPLTSCALGFVGSSALGVAGGIVAWFATNYWGRTLLKFWDLRLEAHETMFFYANVSADRPATLARAEEGRVHLRQLGAKIEGITTVLPTPIYWYLHIRNYDLHLAARGLTGLSNSLGGDDSGTVRFRVQAQRGLCLPVDPIEREQVDRKERLDDIPL